MTWQLRFDRVQHMLFSPSCDGDRNHGVQSQDHQARAGHDGPNRIHIKSRAAHQKVQTACR